jgi:hydrogenase/urease accessory protein HupE
MTKTFASFSFLVACFFALCLAMTSSPAQAHAFDATEGLVHFIPDNKIFVVRLNMNLEAILAGVDPAVKDTRESPQTKKYDRLRSLPPDQLEAEFAGFREKLLSGMTFLVDGVPVTTTLEELTFREVGDLSKPRKTLLSFTGGLPPEAKTFAFGWKPEFGKILFRTVTAHPRSMYVEVVEGGNMSQTLVIEDVKSRSVFRMIGDFVSIGFTHILPKGLDHILFVVGIFLLSTKVRPILSQVTAFTVAHTITLGLGTAGYVNLPPSIVEPLIAASIIYVAIENIWRATLSPLRPMVVFCFGLLHGLGFAGILREFKIPDEDFVLGLLSFNVGVELGQLAIITICFLLVGIWFGNKPWYRQRIVIPGSVIIAIVAAYWFIQRTTGLWT